MEPVAEQLRLPEGYGVPNELLKWSKVRSRIEQAEQYWLATTRPDGRPHVVPVDGVWIDDVWFYGGAEQAVHHRNLLQNTRAVVHLPETIAVVIVEGVAQRVKPSMEEARRIAETTRKKYTKYGYSVKAEDYLDGLWGVRPTVVLAWDRLNVDATRFVFG
jgi:hypothetical protein